MKSRFMITALVLMGSFAFAEEPVTSSRLSLSDEKSQSSATWEAEAMGELRYTHQRIEERRPLRDTSLPEVSLGVRGRLNPSLSVFAEGAVEKETDKTEFIVKQAYVRSEFGAGERFVLQAGRQFIPVGYLGIEDIEFSSKPAFFNQLFADSRAIDIGVTSELRPLPPGLIPVDLALEAGVFQGQFVRHGDDRIGEASKNPYFVSLTTRYKGLSAFITQFEHQVAFFDPVRARGGGLKWSQDLEGLNVQTKLSLQGEVWDIYERSSSNSEQISLGRYISPRIEFKYLAFEWRKAWTDRDTYFQASESGRSSLEEDIHRIELLWRPHLRLIYEETRGTGGEIAFKDDRALRLKLTHTF